MELLLGSGRIYKFLANKLWPLNPLLIQIGPNYEGPPNLSSPKSWVPMTSLADELSQISSELAELKEKDFQHIYFCLPTFDITVGEGFFPSYTLSQLFTLHLLPYVPIIKEVCVEHLNLHVFVDCDNTTFIERLFVNTIRPQLVTAMAGVPSKLWYMRTDKITEQGLEEWWNRPDIQFNWRLTLEGK